MTFTARMAVLIARHRILAYVMATLALTAFMVLSFMPANAADPLTIASPAQSIEKAKGNCAYLTICRWSDLSSRSEPPIIGMPQVFLVDTMFRFAQFIFFLIGQAFIFVGNLDIYQNLLYFSDGVFAKVSLLSANGTVAAGPLIGLVSFAALIVVAYLYFSSRMTGKKTTGTGLTPTKSLIWMLGGVVVLGLMATASAKNHDGTSRIARIAATNPEAAMGGIDQASISSDSVGNAAKDPKNWQPLSLGWAVAWGNTGANEVAKFAVAGITGVTNAIDLDNTQHKSACDLYIDSMHGLYTAGGKNNGVVELEKLYRAAVLDQYVVSNFGTSIGAQDAWCRVLDISNPVNQQVLISWKANQQKDSSGNQMPSLYQTALDVMIDGEGNWKTLTDGDGKVKTSPSSIDGDSKFGGANFGAGLATSYFSPVKWYNSEVDTRMQHMIYFAMCQPQGGKMVLNSEWAGVTQAGDYKEAFETMSGNERTICSAIANGDADGAVPEKDAFDGKTVAVGFMEKATNAKGEKGETDFQKRLDYTKVDLGKNVIALLFKGQADQKSKFISAESGTSGPAYNYFSTTTGAAWGTGFLTACIMLFVTILIAKIAFPVVLGGAVAQFLGASAMMIIGFALMVMAVWPSKRNRSLVVRTFGVIIGSSLITTLFTVIFLVYAGIFSFIKSVLTVTRGGVLSNAVADTVINGIPVLLAGLISYALMKMLLAKALKFDPTSLKSAMSSSANAVMSPLSKDNKTFGDMMSSSFRGARDLVATPVQDTKSTWTGLRNAGDSVKERTSDILGKASAVKKTVSNLSPQGATATGNKGPAGTDANPMAGIVVDHPLGGRTTAGDAKAGAGFKPNTGPATASSNLSDEQHRQRLMDQLKNAYGTAQAAKVFPNGIPADYASLIAKAPMSEVKRLSKMLDIRVEGSDAPRATPAQAADNMKKFNEMGAETLRQNPNGFDPSVSYAERAATQAQMFRGVNPLSDKDVNKMSESDKQNFNSRKFDLVGDAIPNGRSVSFGQNADVIKGEVVPDPLTSRSVPNAVVRSGSQNLAPIEGVTQDGTSIFGATREMNEDGTPSENWGLATLDSGARQLPPTVFSSSVPPAGVTPEQWGEVSDLHEWIKDHDLKLDSTSMSAWPMERREQASRVADVMGSVMSSQGVPMVAPEKLESMAESGVGVTSADDSFTFGEKVPDSDFKPSGMRKALDDSKKAIEDLQKGSLERAELMMGSTIDSQLAEAKDKVGEQEKLLQQKLNERTSLVQNRAAAQLSGLIDALGDSNATEAQQITNLMNENKWEEITTLLNESPDGDESASGLKDEIYDIVQNSQRRIASLRTDHSSNVAQLYAQLAEERESITERMHSDIESELQNDIERNADSVRELAFSGASESSRKHVEGMLSWFPSVKSRFFSSGSANHVELDDMEDADGDGVDDRLQASV